MKSALAKGLHRIGGKPMLSHVLEKAKALNPSNILVVYGHGGSQLQTFFQHEKVKWVLQATQLGTGDAVSKALPEIPANHRVLILYADTPLVATATLQALLTNTPSNALGIVTAQVRFPKGLGRIIRNSKQKITAIIEEKEANETERAIHEVNTGIVLYEQAHLAKWLPKIHNDNAQGEYYLTDTIGLASKEGVDIVSVSPLCEEEILGVNDRLQQASMERFYQFEQAKRYLEAGVEMKDPHRFDVRGELDVEPDVIIDINCLFEGKNVLHRGCKIGPHCTLINCEIGEDVTILAHCHLENVKVGHKAVIGPFARLRPGTVLSEEVHIGNFVEVKNSVVGAKSKINHLSYIGDAQIGQNVNVGAGTITCNYDGANKHQTIIEDDVHIGSDTQLVAPVRVGRGATLAAGTTLTKDAPSEQLTLTHQLDQRSQAWQRPVKPKAKDEKE